VTFDVTFQAGELSVKFECPDFTRPGYGSSRLDPWVTVTAPGWQVRHEVLLFGSDFEEFGAALLQVHGGFVGDIELRETLEYADFRLVLHFRGARHFALSGFVQSYAYGHDEYLTATPALRLDFSSGDDTADAESFMGELLDLLSLMKAYP
jgi:hypothetical protein